MAESVTKLPVERPSKTVTSGRKGLSPWPPFESLHAEIDRIFDEFGRGRLPSVRRLFDMEPLWSSEAPFRASLPAIDVVEKEKEYQISAELPGIDEKDIEVSVTDGVLTVKGEKKEQKEEKDKNYHRLERQYGSFQRSFELPPSIDQGKIEAKFEKGVLTLTLPKTAEAQEKPKTIAIKSK